jgi:hypothetical protein
MGLENLQSLFSGGINANVAPAAASQPTQAVAPTAEANNPFGQVLARLRGAKASAPNLGALPDVRGKDRGSALYSGLSAGMQANVQDQQNAAANNLAQMKLQWDHEAAVAKQAQEAAQAAETARHNKATEDQAATNNKTLAKYYDGLNENGKAKLEGAAKEWDPWRKTEALMGMQKITGYNPNAKDTDKADWDAKSPEEKQRSEDEFRALFKWNFGTDYPVDKTTGKAVPPPPLPPANNTGFWDKLGKSLGMGSLADKDKKKADPGSMPADPGSMPATAPGLPTVPGLSSPATASPAAAAPPRAAVSDDPNAGRAPAAAAPPQQQDATEASSPNPPTPADQWHVIHNPKTDERALYNPVKKETRPFNDSVPSAMQNTQQGAAIGDPAADDPAAGLTQ